MNRVEEKITKLKNIYTGEVVCTSNLFEKKKESNYTFITVFKEENPKRKYLVNEEAFVPVTK